MWRKVGFGFLCALITVSAFSLSARAQSASADVSGWTVTGGLYGWFPWVQGTSSARDETFGVYATPIDLIENFDAPPIMANVEARRGKFSIWADVLYAEFAFGGGFTSEANPIPGIKISSSGGAQTDYDLGIYQFGGFFQVADFTGAQGKKTTVELGAGARFIQQDFRIKAQVDRTTSVRLGRLTDAIERRIQRIENRGQRVQALAALNSVREGILDKRIVRSEDRGRERRVARLERRLKGVDDRGNAIAALEALGQLRLELLQAALNVNGREFNNEFVFINSGNMDWVDPTIALRLNHHLGNGHSITATGDFGGFNIDNGLSTQMALTYDIEGTLWGFQTASSLGYKALWLDFQEQTPDGERGMNVWLHGPIAEFAFRW